MTLWTCSICVLCELCVLCVPHLEFAQGAVSQIHAHRCDLACSGPVELTLGTAKRIHPDPTQPIGRPGAGRPIACRLLLLVPVTMPMALTTALTVPAVIGIQHAVLVAVHPGQALGVSGGELRD